MDNNKINWKRKLSSRKLWAAIAGFIGPLLLAFGIAQDTVTQVVSLIIAGASVVSYIIGEGMVDAGRESAGNNIYHEEGSEENINE